MGKVFNIVGSYFSKAELIPEGSKVVELVFGEESDNSYFEGEYYKEGDIKFFAIFQLPEEAGGGYTKRISIPPSECKPTNFNPKEPFTRIASDDYTVEPKPLTFSYTYNGITVENTWRIEIYPKEFILQSIKIEKQAGFKTEYYDGEIFDNSHMIVKAVGTNGLEKVLPYVDPSLAETYEKNCYTYTKDITVNFIENGNQTVISPDIHEAKITLTCYVRTAGSGNGQQVQNAEVGVRVLRDSKKMQFTNISTNQDYINLYFNGTEFVDSGISVFGKYPWDQEEQDLTAKCEFIAKYNNKSISVGSPINYAPGIKTGEVIVKYKDTQNGNKITSSDEYGEKFKINFQVYDISNVVIQPPPEGTKFNVNDKLVDSNNQPIFPMTINYTDATVPPRTGVKNYKLLQDSNGIIDGAFKLTKPGTVIIKGRYETKSGSIESTNNFSIVVERQVKKIRVPKKGAAYNVSPKYDEAVRGYRLNNMPLFITNGGSSANMSNNIIFKSRVENTVYFHDWIESVQINNSSFGNDLTSRTQLYNYILKSEPNAYTYDITITLKKNDDNYTYKWDDPQIVGQELQLQQIQLKRDVNFNIVTSSVSFEQKKQGTFTPDSKSVSVELSLKDIELDVQYTISSTLNNKLDVTGDINNGYTFTPLIESNNTNNTTYRGTVTFEIINSNNFNNLNFTNGTSDSISVTIKNAWFNWDSDTLISKSWIKELVSQGNNVIDSHIRNNSKKSIRIRSGNTVQAQIVNNDSNYITFLYVDPGPSRYFVNVSDTKPWLEKYLGNLQSSNSDYRNGQSSCIWNSLNDVEQTGGDSITRKIKANSSGKNFIKKFTVYPPTLEELGYTIHLDLGYGHNNGNHEQAFDAFDQEFMGTEDPPFYTPPSRVFVFNAAAHGPNENLAITGLNICVLNPSSVGTEMAKLTKDQTTQGLNTRQGKAVMCVSYKKY